MATEAITLQIDSEAAQTFRSVPTEAKEKLGLLISIWLKGYSGRDQSALKKTMDDISRNAQARGLTPDILDDILKDE